MAFDSVPIMEIGFNLETVLGSATTGTFLGFLARKWFVNWTADRTQIARATADTEQFKALQDAIAANKRELAEAKAEAKKEHAELRGQVMSMSNTIHVQQRTITRMEVLLRQLIGHNRQTGTPVPDYIQAEFNDLVKGELEGSSDQQP